MYPPIPSVSCVSMRATIAMAVLRSCGGYHQPDDG
jgi:hypothetical protein